MKKLLLITLIILLFANLFGCDKGNYNTYKEASINTGDVAKGKALYNVVIENKFDTEGLPKEEIKELNYIKEIEMTMNLKHDYKNNQVISRNYFNFGGMGFDSIFYMNGENLFLKMPILGKYLNLNQIEQGKEYTEGLEIDEKLIERIRDKWLNALKEENVVSGEKALLDTEDGTVKATHYSITLDNNKLNTLVNETVDIILENPELIGELSKYIRIGGKENINPTEIAKYIEEYLETVSIEDFKYDTYIDIDDYIVKTDLEFGLIYKNNGRLKGNKFIFNSKRWDIEKEQQFVFPELNESNTLEIEDADQGIPVIFEDIFNNGEESR